MPGLRLPTCTVLGYADARAGSAAAVHSDCIERDAPGRSAREAPAGGALAALGDRRVEDEAVEPPWRWTAAPGTERGGKATDRNLDRPSGLPDQGAHGVEDHRIVDRNRLPLQHQVRAVGQAHGDRAGRVGRQVARFAGARTAQEVEVAVVPADADAGGVRSSVRPNRAEVAGEVATRVVRRRRGRERIAHPAPRYRGVFGAAEVCRFNRCEIRHLSTSGSWSCLAVAEHAVQDFTCIMQSPYMVA